MTNSYFTDPRDGETYRTVKIGNRIWFAENLRHKCEGAQAYAGGMGYLCLNGETPPYDWNCDPNVKKYGLCYYWKFAEAAVPKGWRLPNNDDWRDLFNAVGVKCEMGEHGAETYLGAALALKSKDGWEEDELFPVGKSADVFGFTAYPAGCMEEFGFCGARGRHTRFWSSVGQNKWAYRVCLDNCYDDAVLDRFWNDFSCANSIRCVKDC